jgi:RND family efflux transporter MFP subunit
MAGLALVLASCGGKPEHKTVAAPEQAPVPVKTVTVASMEVEAFHEATGTLRSRSAAAISSRVMAYVREVRAQAGDRVGAGDLLVSLDARDLETGQAQAEAGLREARSALPEAASGIAAARAGMELAQTTMKRMRDLLDKKSISNQEFDEAQARLRVAEAQHEMALAKQSQLESKIRQAEESVNNSKILRSYAEVRAPFAGLITERRVEPGALAAPGQPLLMLEKPMYRFEASLEESRLPHVRVGQPVEVSLDAGGQSSGRVAEIVPAVDAASRSFLVKIDLPQSASMRSGMFGRARFPAGKRMQLRIPAEAIANQGQVQSVLAVDQETARVRLITTGMASNGGVEVLSGLAAGDRIVSPRTPGVGDGTRVRIQH